MQSVFVVTGGPLTDSTTVQAGSELPAVNTHLAYNVVARYADRLGNARVVSLSPAGLDGQSELHAVRTSADQAHLEAALGSPANDNAIWRDSQLSSS